MRFSKGAFLCFSLLDVLSIQVRRRLSFKRRSFLEVYRPGGTPYPSWVYRADEGMPWASKWAALSADRNFTTY